MKIFKIQVYPLQMNFLNEIQNPEELMIANQNLDQVLEHIKSMKKNLEVLLK